MGRNRQSATGQPRVGREQRQQRETAVAEYLQNRSRILLNQRRIDQIERDSSGRVQTNPEVLRLRTLRRERTGLDMIEEMLNERVRNAYGGPFAPQEDLRRVYRAARRRNESWATEEE